MEKITAEMLEFECAGSNWQFTVNVAALDLFAALEVVARVLKADGKYESGDDVRLLVSKVTAKPVWQGNVGSVIVSGFLPIGADANAIADSLKAMFTEAEPKSAEQAAV